MIKKTVGSLIAVSVLSVGFGGLSGMASTIDQNQESTGWDSMLQFQSKNINSSNKTYNAGQSHSVFANGFQVQNGKSSGSAEASQSQDISVQAGGTKVEGQVSQSASTSGSSYLTQTQSTSNAAFNFQGSIEGGPKLQHQMSHNHIFQYSSTISRP